MQNLKSTLLSLGAAVATTKLAHLVSSVELNDVLRPVGLSRRRAQWPGNLAILGAGIVVGGVAALLFAPASGEKTRARVAKKASELGEVALQKARDLGQDIRDEVAVLTPHFGNDGARATHESA